MTSNDLFHVLKRRSPTAVRYCTRMEASKVEDILRRLDSHEDVL